VVRGLSSRLLLNPHGDCESRQIGAVRISVEFPAGRSLIGADAAFDNLSQVVVLAADGSCSETTEHGELADVVVSVQGIGGKSAGASAKPAVLDQKSCLYVPQIIAVQTGQKLIVKNSDPVMHNVDVQPANDSGNPSKNEVQVPGAADLTFSFPKPEMFLKIKCDVHAWMFAWVSVFDHPYFAVSAKDGTFKIPNVPAGKYTLQAAHRKAGTVTREVEVKEGEPARVDFTLEAK